MESEAAIEAALIQYAESRGYKESAAALKKETRVAKAEEIAAAAQKDNGEIQNIIKFYLHDEGYPKRYEDSYTAYKEWAEGSLDVYKADLQSVLYPLFVHCFLDLIDRGHATEAHRFLKAHRHEHSAAVQSDIDRLAIIFNPEHLKENKFAQSLRQNKMQVHLSHYAFELLLAFLHDRKFMLLLAILNVRVHVQVTPGVPKRKDEASVHDGPMTLLSEADEKMLAAETINIKFGLNTKQSRLAGVRHEAENAPTTMLSLPVVGQTEEERILAELGKRVQLSADSKPSIAFFSIFNSHQGVNRIGVNRDASLIAAGMSSSIIKLFDVNEDDSKWTDLAEKFAETDGRADLYKNKKRPGREVELIGHSGPVFGLSFSPDDNFLLSSSADSTVRLWSMATKGAVAVYRGHSHPVWDVQFSPLGFYFATASNDRTARLWVTSQVHPVRLFVGHLSDVNCVRFHPNCNYIFTGSSDKTIRMWDVNNGETVRLFTGHTGAVYSLAVSPDGRFLASSGEECNISIWDLKTSKRIALLKGHSRPVWSLDFSSDSTMLASGSLDKTVRLWNIQPLLDAAKNSAELTPSELAPLATYPTKKTPVFHVAFTRMNLLLAAGRFDRDSGEADGEEGEDEPIVDRPM